MKIFYSFVLSSTFAVVSYASVPDIIDLGGVPDEGLNKNESTYEGVDIEESLFDYVKKRQSLVEDVNIDDDFGHFNASEDLGKDVKKAESLEDLGKDVKKAESLEVASKGESTYEVVDIDDDFADISLGGTLGKVVSKNESLVNRVKLIPDDDVFDLYDHVQRVSKAVFWATPEVPESIEELQSEWNDLKEKLTVLTPENCVGAENLVKLRARVVDMTNYLSSVTAENINKLKTVWEETEELFEIMVPYPDVTMGQVAVDFVGNFLQASTTAAEMLSDGIAQVSAELKSGEAGAPPPSEKPQQFLK